jgi:hypothetical protein
LNEPCLYKISSQKHPIQFPSGINGWIPSERGNSLQSFLQTTDEKPTLPTGKNKNSTTKTKQTIPLPPAPAKIPVPKPQDNTKLALTSEQEKANLYQYIKNNSDIPQELPIKTKIGKFGLMWPRQYALDHEASDLLSSYAELGCPVDCGPNWTQQHIKLALERGPHISAKNKQAEKQLRIETAEKVKHGYARIVTWNTIKNNVPEKLKISPIAMIPHKTRKFRAILDLSFNLFHKGKKYTSVNETTSKKSKAESMTQLGLTIKRIVATMAQYKNPDMPFKFSKIDIKDGFWRMAVNDENAWNFCYVLPSKSKNATLDDTEIVVPNSLQMGWCESPPFFCASTETARDVMERFIQNNTQLPDHKFETLMLPAENNNAPTVSHSPNKHSTLLEVFVDDFIGMTNQITPTNLTNLSRAMIHGVHSVFPPPDVSGHNGHDPISQPKLQKGEGLWEFKKEVLGWSLDGKNFTLQLPPPKCEKIRKLIKHIISLKRVSLNKFQKLAGKLQHASFGIPGGTGLFSPIQRAMANNPDFINITKDLIVILEDWRYMVQFMIKHPTSVSQLIVEYPNYIGYSDSCGIGTGGIWTSGTSPLSPILWNLEWPQDIKSSLITFKNKKGTLTMNDLELAGAVLNWLVLECQQDVNLTHKHIGIFCDNTSAVAWAHKLRTSKSIVAGRLLRMLGMRIHSRQASSLTPLNIAGEDNTMADIVSRAFKTGKYFTASENLTSYFNVHFPLTQKKSWTEYHLPNALASRVISCLRGELLPMASLLRLPRVTANTGNIGQSMPQCAALTLSSEKHQPLNETSRSQPSLQGSGLELTAKELKSKFRESRMPSHPSPRPYSWLENPAHSTGRKMSTISRSKEWLKGSGEKILPQPPN